MKSEKGEVLEYFIVGLAVMVILGIITVMGYAIKSELDYGTKNGIVVDKQYNSSYTTTIHSGKILVPKYHPATWKLKIQKEINEEVKSIWVSVDETTYHNFSIGDYYPEKEEK